MNRPIMGFALCTLLISICLQPVVAQDSNIDRTEDWKLIEEWLQNEPGFSDAQRRSALEQVAERLRQNPQLTDAEFYLEVRRLTAMADNGHSNVSTVPVFTQFGLAPLRTYWFSDGLYIVRARGDLRRFIGGKMVAVEGMPVDEVAERLKVYHGGTMPFFKHYTASTLILSPALIEAAKISEDADLTITVALPQGGEEDVTIRAQDAVRGLTRVRPWRSLASSPIAGEDDGWSSAFEAGAAQPLALQDEEALFRYLLLDEGKTAYIQFRANIGSQPVPINTFVENTLEQLKADKPQTIILDNRFNGGGDLTRTADFGLTLPSLVPDNGKVLVLTGNGTFSAGIYNAFYPKAADPGKTVIIGQMVGDRTRFWAERGLRAYRLPQSGYVLNYSLQLHDIGAGCPDKEICHLANRTRWNVAVGSLAPDVSVETTLADFMAGRDPVLEAALKLANASSAND